MEAPRSTALRWLVLILWTGAVLPARTNAGAATGSWLDTTMLKLRSMEFEFARAESDIPFLPVMALGVTPYGRTSFREGGEGESFRPVNATAYGTLPLYIGERGLALAVPFAGYTHFDFSGDQPEDASVTAVYIPAGLAWQTDSGRQWVVFGMPEFYTPLEDGGDTVHSMMGGVIGRSFQGERTVWYYGAVYDRNFSDGYFLPYLGFTHAVNQQLNVSMIAPWPSVNYAVNRDVFLRAGVAPSGASWDVRGDAGEREAVMSFGGWNAGVWANARIRGTVWGALGCGYSGLRGLELDPDGEANFDVAMESEPWITVSISVRPEQPAQ
jgi:hypothetical protein